MRSSTFSTLCAAGLLAAVAAPSMAQTKFNPLQGDFEFTAPWYQNAYILTYNWHVPGNDPEVSVRTNGDGGSPAMTAKSGNNFIQMNATGTGGFRGLTTDITNYVLDPVTGLQCSPVTPALCVGPFPYHDYSFDFNGGDITFSVWYNIPGTLATPLNPEGELVLIKAEIKGGGNGFQNNAGPYEFSVSSVDVPTTNGQWRQIVGVVPGAQIRDEFAANVAAGYFGPTPEPNRVKITLGRFTGGANTGTVFFDQVMFNQGTAQPPSCLSDVASDSSDVSRSPNGSVGPEDLEAFVNGFIAENADIADVASDSSDTAFTPNGSVGPEDLEAFVNSFIAGC